MLDDEPKVAPKPAATPKAATTPKPAAKAAPKPPATPASTAANPKPSGDTIRTADGKTVEIIDASPVGVGDSKVSGAPVTDIALIPVSSLLSVFQSAETVATQGIRAHVSEYDDDELQEIDKTARTAEAIGWRMACSVRHEMVTRLKRRVEDSVIDEAKAEARKAAEAEGKTFDESAAIAVDANKIKSGLTEHMKALATAMGIGWRDLYVSHQIEKTYFYDTNLDDKGNVIPQEAIENAISILQTKRFMVEALRCKKPSPGAGLLLLAEKKLSEPRYSTRDAALDISDMNGAIRRPLAEDEEDTDEDGDETTAKPAAAPATSEALSIGRLSIPGMSGDAISFLQNIVEAVKKVEKNKGGILYIYRNSDASWTTSGDVPKARIPMIGCIAVRPGQIVISANFPDSTKKLITDHSEKLIADQKAAAEAAAAAAVPE